MSAPAAGPAAKAAPSFNTLRASGLQDIFKTMTTAGKNLGAVVRNTGSSKIQQVFTEENGSYALSVVFWLMLYLFIGFLIAIFVHYSVTPIFRFSPGQKGLIGVPGATDDKVYWNERVQPAQLSVAPLLPPSDNPNRKGVLESSDDLATYPFKNDFTFSIDVLLRKLNESSVAYKDGGQVILIKSGKPSGTTGSPARAVIPSDIFGTGPPNTTESTNTIGNYYKTKANMILYVTNTNDLVCTFFSGSGSNEFSTRPITNIPVYKPFRITVVAESKTFTIFINGKQVFQKVVSSGIDKNTLVTSPVDQDYNCFYSPPDWQASQGKSVFLQNFHLWPRAISYTEVTHAKPALATVPDFDAPKEVSALCVA